MTDETTPDARNGARILVIEDEALVARELKSRLTNLGWDVAGIAYGRDGIELARETQPDLLLSDIHLKNGVDGIEVAMQIQAERDLPVVFLTAYSDQDTVDRAKAASPFGYIIKPVENRDLQITIEMALYRFRTDRELKETKQLLETALQCIGTALVFVDQQGIALNLSKDAVTLFGEQGQGKSWDDILCLDLNSSIGHVISNALKNQKVTRLAPFVISHQQRRTLLLDGIVGPMDDGGVLILRELAEYDDAIETLPPPALLDVDESTLRESALCQLLVSPDIGAAEADSRVFERMSKKLDAALRATDVMSVLADSLLSISLPDTSIEEARLIADTLGQELSTLEPGRTYSMGLARSLPGDQQPLELFRRAAEALDRVRESGGDALQVWKPRLNTKLTEVTSDKEYQQLILLWNVMNVVSRGDELADMAYHVCRHMLRVLGLDAVALLTRKDAGITALVGITAEREHLDSITDLGLSESEFNLVDAFFAEYDGDAQYLRTYLFHVSTDFVLFLRSGHEFQSQEVNFLRTLVSYFAGGITRVAAEDANTNEIDSAMPVLVHNSPQMASILESVKLVAPTDATVLLMGDSGTGKELLARHLHESSKRKDQPFVIVDCGTVVESLIESELFGHEQGAFTGADRRFPGRLKEAAGGTVLLDEIGDLPLPVQVKLLRFVEDRTVAAVGSTRYEPVDTRVIAATNKDLKSMVDSGLFREDLYYRLNVFTIRTLPLRERPDDVLVLAKHYLALYAQQYGKGALVFSAEAEQALKQYRWPGNVRELMNVVNRSVIMSKEKRVGSIHLGLFPSIPGAVGRESENSSGADVRAHLNQLVTLCLSNGGDLPPIGQWLEEDLILDQVAATHGVLSQAAMNLGLPETTLRRKVRRLKETDAISKVRPSGWEVIDSPVVDELVSLSKSQQASVLDLAQGLLVDEFEKRHLTRQDGAKLLGVSLPTYRRFLS
jgi:hydrogenase-4 transcriptional activator